MRKYRQYTDQDVIHSSKEVKSIAELLRKLNLKEAGGNYTHIKKTLQRLKINTDHWTGQGWSKGQQKKDWSQYSKVGHLKKHLIKKKGHKCENCGLTEWQKQSIVLEVHHEDGDRTNNDFSNLKLLCCNCHALTHNWRNKNKNI
jgi:hypothetical protein